MGRGHDGVLPPYVGLLVGQELTVTAQSSEVVLIGLEDEKVGSIRRED
jgi:hypothetical protein